ncbi:retrovirus-related pol polyprotein from transposon TNT 1-94 [Tanacetum coccineum]
MTNFPEISRRARDRYHNLKDDDIMKNIFNSGRYKDKVGMKIPTWMISEEIKHTEHYRMYMGVFGIDVPLTQRVSSAPKRSTMIHFRIPQRRSTRLTPPAPVPTVDKADEMILQDTLQVSLAEHKSREEQEARENVELVNKHLASVEIEKMVEGPENVIDDSSIPRNDDQNIPGTRLEPRSDKESPEVEITNDEEVEITNVVIPVNVNEEEEEITDEVYELKRREKGKIVEESRSTPFPTPIRSPRIHTDLVSSDTEKLQELTEVMVESLPTMVDKHIKEQVEKQVPKQVKVQVLMYVAKGLLLERQQNKEETDKMIAKAILQEPQPQTTFVPEQQYQLYLSMKADLQLQQQDIAIWLALQMKFETLQVPQTTCRTSVVRRRDQDDPHDDAHPKGENNDDEILTKQVSQYIIEEVSLTVNEAELKKIAGEMLRQRCTSGDEHQYHIDQMKNFLKSDIVWESRKEILASPHPRKTTPLVPALSLINQDLLYLKKGSLGPEKICVKKFTPYARYGVEHWKNPHAKIFYIGKPKKVVYSNSKIIQPDYKNINKNDIEDMYLLIMNGKETDTTYLLLYFDDIVLTASSESLLQQIIRLFHQEFAMTDLGPLSYFLGISVTHDSSGLFLSSKKYAVQSFERAGMVNCNPSRTPVDTESKLGDTGVVVSDPTLYRSLAGSLQYLTLTRPDISYVVQQVCLHMHDPQEPHYSALKWILRYVCGTLDYGLQLFSSTTSDLVAYSDADWAGCPTTRRSTSGYCVFLGNNLLSWSSKRQPTLSRSSAKVEYRGVANAIVETCWLSNLLRELPTLLSSATLVYCDNDSAVYLSCNPIQHQRTKHIEIDIYFVCDLVAAGQVRVLHVPSRYQFCRYFH